MAAVARKAGLRYTQITYSFKDRQGFLEALEEYRTKQRETE